MAALSNEAVLLVPRARSHRGHKLHAVGGTQSGSGQPWVMSPGHHKRHVRSDRQLKAAPIAASLAPNRRVSLTFDHIFAVTCNLTTELLNEGVAPASVDVTWSSQASRRALQGGEAWSQISRCKRCRKARDGYRKAPRTWPLQRGRSLGAAGLAHIAVTSVTLRWHPLRLWSSLGSSPGHHKRHVARARPRQRCSGTIHRDVTTVRTGRRTPRAQPSVSGARMRLG